MVTYAEAKNASAFGGGEQSVFLKRGFPQIANKKLAIPFTITPGGHMFPLELPVEVVTLVKTLIQAQAKK